ncbi:MULTISPECIES: flavin monoamine oxidase family protein [unclassified Maridesulfovibrio]|uniref:flavin monoamine oxidase family protein n=1 Tax=unclassified Maridesulfovibrio TaxID=2794999 RepID=UPI003B423A28
MISIQPAPCAYAEDDEPEYHEIVIVGGGIAGLSTAYHLPGRDVLVLEKQPEVGGRSISGYRDGYWYAKGTEYVGVPYGALKNIVDGLNMTLLPIVPPMDAIWTDGKIHYGFSGMLKLLTRKGGLRGLKRFHRLIMNQYALFEEFQESRQEGIFSKNKDLQNLDAMTAAQWMDKNEIPQSYKDKYNVTAMGLFGANLDEISALSLFEEVAFDFEGFDPSELEDEEGLPIRNGDESAFSFRTGIAEVSKSIAKHLGPAVRTSSTVTSIERNAEGGYTVHYLSGGNEIIVEADIVVIAVPAPIAAKIASKVIPEEQSKVVNNIKYAPYVTCALFFSEPIFTKSFDLAMPPDFFFTDFYDSTWVQRHKDPKAPKNIYINSAYIAPKSFKDNSILKLSDTEIVDRVFKDLEKVFPGSKAKMTGYDIHRFTHAYPVMEPGTLMNLAKLNSQGNGSLFFAGDWTLYPTFESACDSGRLAAERILEELND